MGYHDLQGEIDDKRVKQSFYIDFAFCVEL